MFLLFEQDIPFGVPTTFMDTSTKRKYETLINESIQTSGDMSQSSGMVVPVILAVPVGSGVSQEDVIPQKNASSVQEPVQQDVPETSPPSDDNETMTLNPEGDPSQDQTQPEQPSPFDQEITPLKKLYLIQKLYRMNELLIERNISSKELAYVLKYGANLSYPTVVSLAAAVISNIQSKLDNPDPNDQLVDPNAQTVDKSGEKDSEADILAQKINQVEAKKNAKEPT